MRRQSRREWESGVEMQMGPMIDIVFLLLIFFIVTAKPVRQESDLGMGLPGGVEMDEAMDLPDEQRIVILETGALWLNDYEIAKPEDVEVKELKATLIRFRKTAELNKVEALVTIDPEDHATHQRIVDVLNACAVAGIEGVTFAMGEEG